MKFFVKICVLKPCENVRKGAKRFEEARKQVLMCENMQKWVRTVDIFLIPAEFISFEKKNIFRNSGKN